MELTLDLFKLAAIQFAADFATRSIRELFGVTDGKAVGTWLEREFNQFLAIPYQYARGNAASGIDFPALEVDVKVTSIRQPQSSCPFQSASQKIYGLGYHLLIFIYEKVDDTLTQTAHLQFLHVLFIEKTRTADYQTTRGLLEILKRDGNADDVEAFLVERNLPLDEIGRQQLTQQILRQPPNQGVLTISNALQWRLQYGRAIELSGREVGVEKLR
ncbi:MAG: hypothetical protein BroJett018_26980 [Chloroflexota bacterium]|nr:MAG: hypothetical protein BroJett018_26980 [Chloroflexota bacterium]